MDTWNTLIKELAFYGILLKDNICHIHDESGKISQKTIQSIIKELSKKIKKNSDLLYEIFSDISELVSENNPDNQILDPLSSKLFIFSLKDLVKFMACFEEFDNTEIKNNVLKALDRDVDSFNSMQIRMLPNYKVCIDWLYRKICILKYQRNLLSMAKQGKKFVSGIEMKTARGISGPWANLDLPILERVYPYEEEQLTGRDRDKRRQKRYTRGFANYNNDGRVGEGFYWREPRNEPFLWEDRFTESPYPIRKIIG